MPDAPPSMHAIASATAEEFDLSLAELKAKTNRTDIVVPRQIAMMLMREVLGLTEDPKYSLNMIGKFFGGKHHTTVLDSVIRAEGRMERPELARRVERIRIAFSNGSERDITNSAPPRPVKPFRVTGRRLLRMLEAILTMLASIDQKLGAR